MDPRDGTTPDSDRAGDAPEEKREVAAAKAAKAGERARLGGVSIPLLAPAEEDLEAAQKARPWGSSASLRISDPTRLPRDLVCEMRAGSEGDWWDADVDRPGH